MTGRVRVHRLTERESAAESSRRARELDNPEPPGESRAFPLRYKGQKVWSREWIHMKMGGTASSFAPCSNGCCGAFLVPPART